MHNTTTDFQNASHAPRYNRLLVAWLPYFRLERCGWTPHESVALTEVSNGVPRVIATSRGANRHGVRIGMSSIEARTTFPQLHLETLNDLSEEQHDLHVLCMQLQSLSPHPYCINPDTICAPIGQTSHLLGGEDACIELALRLLRRLGHWSRIWIVDGDRAGSDIAAKALAQWTNTHRVLPSGSLRDALKNLPLRLMPIQERLLESLYSVGIRTGGDLAKIPPSNLAQRYGKELLKIHQTVHSVRSDAIFEHALRIDQTHIQNVVFHEPASTFDELSEAIKQLVKGLVNTLINNNQAASGLRLVLSFEANKSHHSSLRLAQPSQSTQSFLLILKQHLSNTSIPARVEELSIEAHDLTPYEYQQRNLWDHNENKEDFDALRSRLEERFGKTGIFFSATQDSHLPEKAWIASGARNRAHHRRKHRPALMLKTPQPIQVYASKDDQIHAVSINGRRLQIQHIKGPEWLCGAWWNNDQFDRCYWSISLMEHQKIWIFCDNNTRQWWLHGWFE